MTDGSGGLAGVIPTVATLGIGMIMLNEVAKLNRKPRRIGLHRFQTHHTVVLRRKR